MNQFLQGAAAEHIAAAFFLRRGYDVLWPAADGCRYDFTAEQGGEWTKVQVKKVTRTPTGQLRVKCTPNGGRRVIYRAGDFDVLVAVDGFRIWIIPYRDVATRGMLTLDTPATAQWLQKG